MTVLLNGRRCVTALVVVLIVATQLAGCGDAPTDPDPLRRVFSSMPSDTPPADVCAWMECREPTPEEWAEIEGYFAAYFHPDPVCNTLLAHQAWAHLNRGKLFLIDAYHWQGGPWVGDGMGSGAYHHPSRTMFVHSRYMGSPSEFIRFSIHEGAHAQWGAEPEVEDDARYYDSYCSF